jgi:hypothetical protein
MTYKQGKLEDIATLEEIGDRKTVAQSMQAATASLISAYSF